MIESFARLITTPSPVRTRIVRLYVFLVAFNVGAWALTLLASVRYPILLPTAFLAYTFGLRHAVDADHIAAIDNTTRKLMQDGQRPVGVGFFFSLGHSSVVVLLVTVIAVSASIVSDIPTLQEVGGLIGTAVSAAFLLLIGVINLIVLVDIYRMFQQVSRGGSYSEETLEEFLSQRGLLARLLRPMLRVVRRSWHMYPLGLLFGLGFDTASEVALLGLAASSGANHVPILFILVLPILFAAGMSLVDATDGVLMLGAYGWAYVKPIRKLYYNLNITLVSVLIAFAIGGIEVMAILAERLGLTGGVWDWVGGLNFEVVGFGIIGIFVVSWSVSTFIYRRRGYDALPVQTPRPPSG
jgi:nickel/cobalt transporter (NiCoT) family protein